MVHDLACNTRTSSLAAVGADQVKLGVIGSELGRVASFISQRDAKVAIERVTSTQA